MNRLLRRLMGRGLRPVTRLAARAYVAGPTLDDALNVCHRLAAQGFSTTLGFWNREEDAPAAVARAYAQALSELERRTLDCYLSIKAPALHGDERLVRAVVDQATERSIGVHFDSLGPEWVDQTLALVERMLPRAARLGCTLPGRWGRSVYDAGRMAQRDVAIRVVKGQWPDRAGADVEAREGFLAIISQLAGRAKHVAVATHDAPLARQALVQLQRAGTRAELELLFGLPMRQPLQVARSLNVAVRVYVPYGTAWLPYALGRAARQPRFVLWLVHDALAGAMARLAPASSSPATGQRVRGEWAACPTVTRQAAGVARVDQSASPRR